MATWHIPLRNFDDALEGLFDLTFPPRRYLPLVYDWPLAALNRGNEEERLGRQFIQPYALQTVKNPGNPVKRDTGFKVELNVKHYKPDEITLKVEGLSLTVQGKHEHESENGFEKSEFCRKYTLPQDVDTRSLRSKITQDGILCIEAANLPKTLSSNLGLATTSDKMEYVLDVSGYKPEEISVKVVGRNLIICGEARKAKDEGDGQFLHHKQFTRQMNIPEDVDISALSTRYSKEGKVIVEAPRLKSAPAERELELKVDVPADIKDSNCDHAKGQDAE